MNRKLLINIDQVQESQKEEFQQKMIRQDLESNEQEQEEDHSYQQQSDEENKGEQMEYQQNESASNDREQFYSQVFESVQTFGNNPQKLLQQIKSRNQYRQPLLNPYRSKKSPLQLQNQPNPLSKRINQLEHSNVDDQINRIINKVMNLNQVNTNNTTVQNDKANRINKINQKLLSENTGLISQINELQKKLNQVSLRKSREKQSNKSRTFSDLEGKSIFKSLKEYRDKLAKAIELNSKLSIRLQTERSRSRVTSNTFQSAANRRELHHFGQASSVISKFSKDEARLSKKSYLQKAQNPIINGIQQQHFCQRCNNELRKVNNLHSKQLIFSPVLQVKNYTIQDQKQNSNQFQLKNKQTLHSEIECQVNLDQDDCQQELKHLQQQQKKLHKIIDQNNRVIQHYEQSLFKLVDL